MSNSSPIIGQASMYPRWVLLGRFPNGDYGFPMTVFNRDCFKADMIEWCSKFNLDVNQLEFVLLGQIVPYGTKGSCKFVPKKNPPVVPFQELIETEW